MEICFYYLLEGITLMLMCVLNRENNSLSWKGTSGSICVHTHSHRHSWSVRSRILWGRHCVLFETDFRYHHAEQASLDILSYCPSSFIYFQIIWEFHRWSHHIARFLCTRPPCLLCPSTVLQIESQCIAVWPETCDSPPSNLGKTSRSGLSSAVFCKYGRKRQFRLQESCKYLVAKYTRRSNFPFSPKLCHSLCLFIILNRSLT